MGKLRALLILGAVLGPCIIRAADDESAPPSLQLVISVAEQKLAVVKDGGLVRKYPISTSKFGLGDTFNSYRTPLGQMRICDKVGDDLPIGSVLKSRNATGEILPVNAPGRDPIVTRILWLEGLESGNSNARSRGIYIHGTVEESKLGQPVSYGCIRMRSQDVIEVFNEAPVGTPVEIITERFPRFRKVTPPTETLFASNDNITTVFGPRGMVVVRTGRGKAPVAAKPPETPAAADLARVAAAKPTPPPKTADLPAKAIAQTAPPPPVAEGPTVLIPTARSGGRLKVAATRLPSAPVADQPHVILNMGGSILMADFAPKAKPAPLPPPAAPAPAPVIAPEPPPVRALRTPRLLALNLSAISFSLISDEAAPAPTLDALSDHILHPPTPQMRLAFRAGLPDPDL